MGGDAAELAAEIGVDQTPISVTSRKKTPGSARRKRGFVERNLTGGHRDDASEQRQKGFFSARLQAHPIKAYCLVGSDLLAIVSLPRMLVVSGFLDEGSEEKKLLRQKDVFTIHFISIDNLIPCTEFSLPMIYPQRASRSFKRPPVSRSSIEVVNILLNRFANFFRMSMESSFGVPRS